ncbi:MAG: hypothetical protein EU532_11185 [Promethearchaeota archaeon]|nr:MAG: hypothetical protein EU532_11185 [Candidatus Lokiarchaeota archaeon]
MNEEHTVLFDYIKKIKVTGEFNGSIISKFKEYVNYIIFSDNIQISEQNEICISQGLMVGFEKVGNNLLAFSKKDDFIWDNIEDSPLEYSVQVPNEIMEQYDEGQFSDAFPFTITMLHTAGLYLKDSIYSPIDHLEFFQGEILKNPVSLIFNGICVADRVVIDHRGDPVFYDSIIVGRDKSDDLNVSYEPLVNVKMDDDVVRFIIILGIENLKD